MKKSETAAKKMLDKKYILWQYFLNKFESSTDSLNERF